jgi:hypothetical protein
MHAKTREWAPWWSTKLSQYPAVAQHTDTVISLRGIPTVVEIFERSKIARALDITDIQIGSHYSPSSFPYSSALQPIFFLKLLSSLFLPSISVSTANLWRSSKQHFDHLRPLQG